MKFHWTNSSQRWKDSISVSLALLAFIQTIAEVIGLFEIDFVKGISWWGKLVVIVALFIVLTFSVFIFKLVRVHRGLRLKIADNDVIIKEADIFKQDGWKLIPFNERFDTTVDDKIIAHNTLNGYFIDSLDESDKHNLEDCILHAANVSGLNNLSKGSGRKHPLGRIVTFSNEFLLLAFTHFDNNNNAYLSHSDFEKCLLTMWKEISRVYANKPIYIPLLGSGMTRFTDTPHKDNLSLAQCLLCTLKMSGVHLKQPITICLTPQVLDDINIYELKSK